MTETISIGKVKSIPDVAKKENVDVFDFIISKNSEYNNTSEPDLEMFSVVCSSVVLCGDYLISTNVEDTNLSMEKLSGILGKAALCQYAKIINYDKKGEVVGSTEFNIRYMNSAVGYDCTNVVRRTFVFQVIK